MEEEKFCDFLLCNILFAIHSSSADFLVCKVEFVFEGRNQAML